jgi:hypothetical protein
MPANAASRTPPLTRKRRFEIRRETTSIGERRQPWNLRRARHAILRRPSPCYVGFGLNGRESEGVVGNGRDLLPFSLGCSAITWPASCSGPGYAISVPHGQRTLWPNWKRVASNWEPQRGQVMAMRLLSDDRHDHGAVARADVAFEMDDLLPGAEHGLAVGHGQGEGRA